MRASPFWKKKYRALLIMVVSGCVAIAAGCTSTSAAQTANSSASISQPAAQSSAAPDPKSDTGPLTLVSSAFISGGMIPIDVSCAGENTSPPLSWPGIAPAGTTSWAIVMQDLDVTPAPWIQWLITGIPAQTRTVAAGQVPVGAITHRASNSSLGFVGACPPQGKVHTYRFTIFALGGQQSLPASATAQQVVQSLEKAATGTATLTGRFAR